MGTARPELRTRRRYLGLSQERLAELVGVSTATICAWERGSQNPSAGNRPALAEALQVDLAQIHRMIDPAAPLDIQPHAVDHWLDLYESLIVAAGAVQQVETIAMPGLFQTRTYAKVLEENSHLPVSDEDVHHRVELRIARQAVLRREPDPLHYQVLIHEAILAATIGNHDIMAEQLDQLDHLFHEPNIEVRILPFDGQALFARGGFELVAKKGQAKPFLAITIDIDGPRFEQRRTLLADVVSMYQYLLNDVALTPADSLACIRHHLRSHQ